MASKPPSGASRLRDTICFCTSTLKRSTLSVSGRTFRKPKEGTQLGNGLYLSTHKDRTFRSHSLHFKPFFFSSFKVASGLKTSSLFITPKAATQIGSDARCSCRASLRWRGNIVCPLLSLLPFHLPSLTQNSGYFKEPQMHSSFSNITFRQLHLQLMYDSCTCKNRQRGSRGFLTPAFYIWIKDDLLMLKTTNQNLTN